MFDIDDKDLKQMQKNLDNVRKDAFPKAVRSTLDAMAYQTKREYDKNIKKELTIRGNKKANIVPASVGYEKCSNSLNINEMQTFVGQKATMYGKKTDQLRKQEFGETLVAKSKHITKATKFARGNSYKKVVSRENYLAGMNIRRISDLTNYPAATVENQFKQAVAIAHRTLEKGKYIHFLPDDSVKKHKFGVYRLYNSGSEKTENGDYRVNGKSVKFMYSFSDRTQALNPRPMLKPATDKISSNKKEIFYKEAERRMKKELSKKLSQ